MKRSLSLLAVAVLSSVGVSVGATPVQGSLHLDSDSGDAAAWPAEPKKPRCNPACVTGVRG